MRWIHKRITALTLDIFQHLAAFICLLLENMNECEKEQVN